MEILSLLSHVVEELNTTDFEYMHNLRISHEKIRTVTFSIFGQKSNFRSVFLNKTSKRGIISLVFLVAKGEHCIVQLRNWQTFLMIVFSSMILRADFGIDF